MKSIKIIAIATIITIAIMISCACAMPACAEGVGDRGEFYPLLTVVTSVEQIGDTDLWIVECEDQFGRLWGFYCDEGDWQEGDLANLLMWNLGGEHEEEDEVVEVYFAGHLDEGSSLCWGE